MAKVNNKYGIVRKTMTVDALVKLLGILVMVLLPFQRLPLTLQLNGYLANIDRKYIDLIAYTDEATGILLATALASFMVIQPHTYRLRSVPFAAWIIGFLLAAIASMGLNGIEIVQGVFSIYDVTKNILVLFPFMMFRYTEEDLFKTIRWLLYGGVLLSLVGMYGEAIALVFERGIDLFVYSEKRYGFYRVISLAGHGNWNYLGVYATLLFYLVYKKDQKSVRRTMMLSALIFLVIFSFSRQVLLGFILMYFLLSGKSSRWLSTLVTILIVAISTQFYEKVEGLALEGISLDPGRYFRMFAFIQSLELFGQNPFFGIGPGMFGSLASVIFDSPVYSSWPVYFRKMVFSIRGIDQFWPVIWTETGLFGMSMYAMILIGIFRYLRQASIYFANQGKAEMAEIGRVLRYFILSLVVMGFGGGLNAAFVSFTYFALVGMYLSVYHRGKADAPAIS